MTGEVETAPRRGTGQRGRRAKKRGWKYFLRDVLVIFLAAIVISFLIKTFLIRSFYIPSQSMENTLLENDRIIVSLLTPGLTPLRHGDVIVFKDPGDWLDATPPPVQSPLSSAVDGALGFVGLSAPDSNDHLVKRVIGLPGDHVVCCTAAGQLTVNGTPLIEPYIKLPANTVKAAPTSFDVTVPAGSLWVMGDNRYESADSAYHLANHDPHVYVPLSDVVGKAMVVSWPLNRWTVLDDYPDVYKGVTSGTPTGK
ncbi:signal peptidase I [Galbitalea soli]|uniref:Signal peptidase I n=1 Tax=Galbitalea soli TaxID=1268042 RepID=A0A7C9TRA4_9MICO|nr:signal peptidase I [Galbitalea soli]NEM91559.1 signal peptidase I [Galbitalea soli]NYJ30253.1 signal peptidase I [Galbitalea soli]